MTTTIRTSLTLDYRKGSWGPRRIVLDGIQNHLPADSGGTECLVYVTQGGVSVPLENWRRGGNVRKPIDKVVFADNGRGYDHRLLSVLYSTKDASGASAGQFGEGLKLVAAAALRDGVSLQYQSRDWTAKPYTERERIEGNDVDRLCFEVQEGGERIPGSRTVLSNLTEEVVYEIYRIPRNVLIFNGNYRVLHSERDSRPYVGRVPAKGKAPNYPSRIIDIGKPGQLFVKGIKIGEIDTILSYDLGLTDITPDRLFADSEKVLDDVEHLLKGCSNEAVIENVFRTSEKEIYNRYLEFNSLNPSRRRESARESFRYRVEDGTLSRTISGHVKKIRKVENLWVQTFRRLYGERAVIAGDNFNCNRDAIELGYRVVPMDYNFRYFMQNLGIISAEDLIGGERKTLWVNTSDLTPQERAMLTLAQKANGLLRDKGIDAPDIPIRVYDGIIMPDGRRTEYISGFHGLVDGQTSIAICRNRLSNPTIFLKTFLHETGHEGSGADDYTREHADYGYDALAVLVAERLGAPTDGSVEFVEPPTSELAVMAAQIRRNTKVRKVKKEV